MTDYEVEDTAKLDSLSEKLDEAVRALAEVSDFAKPTRISRVFDTARRLMLQQGGCARVEARARQIEEAGVFMGSDWAQPQTLIPGLTSHSLKSPDADTVVVEALSELRLLAIALGDYVHQGISSEQAHHYLTQVMAINLELLFGPQVKLSANGRVSWHYCHETCSIIWPSELATNM